MGVYTGISHGIEMEMQQLKQLLTDDDSAVSPVIGVILMVAITVILAAVIASFVLGLGDQGEPAPNPTVDSSVDGQELTVDFTGGDDFDASVATVQGQVDGGDVEFTLDASSANLDEVSAGDTVTFDVSSDEVQINGNTVSNANDGSAWSPSGSSSIDNWELEIVWNPSDQDSQIIYSDSS